MRGRNYRATAYESDTCHCCSYILYSLSQHYLPTYTIGMATPHLPKPHAKHLSRYSNFRLDDKTRAQTLYHQLQQDTSTCICSIYLHNHPPIGTHQQHTTQRLCIYTIYACIYYMDSISRARLPKDTPRKHFQLHSYYLHNIIRSTLCMG